MRNKLLTCTKEALCPLTAQTRRLAEMICEIIANDAFRGPETIRFYEGYNRAADLLDAAGKAVSVEDLLGHLEETSEEIHGAEKCFPAINEFHLLPDDVLFTLAESMGELDGDLFELRFTAKRQLDKIKDIEQQFEEMRKDIPD